MESQNSLKVSDSLLPAADLPSRSTANPIEPELASSLELPTKRPRDSRGIDKFREIIFGDKGFPRLHAMVERSTILLYPPANVEEQRQEFLKCQAQVDEKFFSQLSCQELGETNVADVAEKRRRIESASLQRTISTEEANYHHKQLECLLKIVYEFNHAALMKLPMNDTLQMLSRCGREATAHLTEFEMRKRLQRVARLDELAKLNKREEELKARQKVVDAATEQYELEVAEKKFREAIEEMRRDVTPSPLPPQEGDGTDLSQSNHASVEQNNDESAAA